MVGPLNDNSLMPFGAHKGTKLANVPASYLLYIFENYNNLREDLKKYIDDHKDVLQAQARQAKKSMYR